MSDGRPRVCSSVLRERGRVERLFAVGCGKKSHARPSAARRCPAAVNVFVFRCAGGRTAGRLTRQSHARPVGVQTGRAWLDFVFPRSPSPGENGGARPEAFRREARLRISGPCTGPITSSREEWKQTRLFNRTGNEHILYRGRETNTSFKQDGERTRPV